MMESSTRLFLLLLVLLAAAPAARPQTAPASMPASQALARQAGKAGSGKKLPARSAMAKPSPGLCFQPGVGWQRTLAGQTNGSATPDANVSAECGGILTDKKELAAGVETRALLPPNRARGSTGPANPGAVTSFHGNAPLHPHDSAGPNSIRTTSRATPPAAGPGDDSDQMGKRAFHAYISPIKLRRLIRNAPDFRTRVKLQQLQNNAATKLRHARVETKTGQVAGKPLPGERVPSQRLRRNNGKLTAGSGG